MTTRSTPSIRFLAREALANSRAFLVRTIVVCVVSASIGAGTTAFTLAEVSGISRSFDQQQLRGVDALTVASPDGNGLDAARCEAVRTISGVVTAGGHLGSRRIVSAHAPGSPITVHGVTPGYLGIAFPAEPALWHAGIVAGQHAAEELGLYPGSHLTLTDRVEPTTPGSQTSSSSAAATQLKIEATAQQESRFSGLNRDIFVTEAPVGPISECLVAAIPGNSDAVAVVLEGWFAKSDIRIAKLVPASQLELDASRQLSTRWSQWGWVIAGSVLVLMQAFLWWSRRSEMALYRFLGFGSGSRLTLVLVDTVLLVAAPAQFGVALAVAALSADASSVALTSVLADAVRFIAVVALAAPAAFFMSRGAHLIDTLKGR